MVVRQTILVTGSNGQLGMELQQLAPVFPQYKFIFVTRGEFNIADTGSVNNFFRLSSPSYCVNCAAYTAVDKAESEPDEAFLINGKAPGILAAACAAHNTRLIHISTDYVFDGTATSPYTDQSPTNPVSIYGKSKLAGENNAVKENPDSVIIRTAWVYSSFGKNFVKTMLRLMSERPEIGVVNDQVGSPTYAGDLADAILKIISSGDWEPGIYHYTNRGIISWFDFAMAIKELSHSSCTVKPITTAQFPTPASRPAYSVLDGAKISATYHVPLIDWKESLITCFAKIRAQ